MMLHTAWYSRSFPFPLIELRRESLTASHYSPFQKEMWLVFIGLIFSSAWYDSVVMSTDVTKFSGTHDTPLGPITSARSRLLRSGWEHTLLFSSKVTDGVYLIYIFHNDAEGGLLVHQVYASSRSNPIPQLISLPHKPINSSLIHLPTSETIHHNDLTHRPAYSWE